MRVARQRGPSPAFVPLAVPVVFLQHNGFLTALFTLATEPGDQYRFQWNSLCPYMELQPAPLDFRLLGQPNGPVEPVSAYALIEGRLSAVDFFDGQ